MEEQLLRQRLATFLTGGQVAVLATADRTGEPHTSLVTWLASRGMDIIAVAIDTRSRHYSNLQENPRAALEVLGDDLILKVAGKVRVVQEQMPGAPFPLAVVEVDLEEVRDHGVPGVEFHGPTYSYAAGKEHRWEAEDAVFRALRG